MIELKKIENNPTYIKNLDEYYKRAKSKRRLKLTNDTIIDLVNERYNLIVNASMISYVRDKIGICIKAKDRRYDPNQKNKRIPNQNQYNAIVEIMKEYNVI